MSDDYVKGFIGALIILGSAVVVMMLASGCSSKPTCNRYVHVFRGGDVCGR